MDIARQRLVLDVMSARKNLLLASPATPAAARLELVGKLADIPELKAENARRIASHVEQAKLACAEA